MKSQKEMILRVLLGIALVLFGANKFYSVFVDQDKRNGF